MVLSIALDIRIRAVCVSGFMFFRRVFFVLQRRLGSVFRKTERTGGDAMEEHTDVPPTIVENYKPVTHRHNTSG